MALAQGGEAEALVRSGVFVVADADQRHLEQANDGRQDPFARQAVLGHVRVHPFAQLRQRAAEGAENTMPFILDAVRAYATLGEICDAFRGVFGVYKETAHI